MGTPRKTRVRSGALRGLAVACVVAAVVGAISLSRSRSPADFLAVEQRLDRPAVRSISIHEGPRDVRLVSTAGKWWIAEPVVLPADEEQVERLLDAWSVTWRTESVVAASPSAEQARELGLYDRRVDLQFESEWETLVRVEVGSALPNGNHHVRIGGGRSVYEASVPGRDLLSPNLEDWLSPELVPFAPDQLATLAVQQGELRGEAEFAYGGTTYRHSGVPMDHAPLPAWVAQAHTYFAAFAAVPASDAEIADAGASLAAPWLIAEATAERRGTFRLDVGALCGNGEDGDRIARIEGDPVLYVLPGPEVAALLAMVPAGPLRDGVPAPPRGPALQARVW